MKNKYKRSVKTGANVAVSARPLNNNSVERLSYGEHRAEAVSVSPACDILPLSVPILSCLLVLGLVCAGNPSAKPR